MMPVAKSGDALFALLDAELAKVKWFSGDEFGVGDIAIAPFIYNLFNVGPDLDTASKSATLVSATH